MEAGKLYKIRFDLKNPGAAQESPAIRILSTSMRFDIEASEMIPDEAQLLGIESGTSPLKIVVPEFTTQETAQHTPVAGFENNISVTLLSSVSLLSAHHATISILGLDGLSFPGDSVSVQNSGSTPTVHAMCAPDGSVGKVGWNASSYVMTWKICAGETMNHSTVYSFQFGFKNPTEDRTSPGILLHASSSEVTFPVSAMHKTRRSVMGVLNGTYPLKIVVPNFRLRNATQSTPIATHNNVLSFLLASTITLGAGSDGSKIKIRGLDNAVASSPTNLTVLKEGEPVAGIFCLDPDNVPEYNIAEFSQGVLTMTICRDFEAQSTYEVQLQVQNPPDSQSSPGVFIEVESAAPFASMTMTKSGTEIFGVSDGAEPMRIIVPELETKDIRQSNLLPGALNLITVNMLSNVELRNSNGAGQFKTPERRVRNPGMAESTNFARFSFLVKLNFDSVIPDFSIENYDLLLQQRCQ